jgi:IS5 family transposase
MIRRSSHRSRAYFDSRIGRPSTLMATYLRLTFLGVPLPARLRVPVPRGERLGHVAPVLPDFLGRVGAAPETMLMKLSTRCRAAAVDVLNEALLTKATEAKVLCPLLRADTTVLPNVSYPTDSGLLAKAIRRIAGTG